MRACAYGERRNTPWVWPGRTTSSVYWPAPVRKRTSSRRFSDCPMSEAGGWDRSVMVGPPSCGRADLAGLAKLDRRHDVLVAGAAADVAVQPGADLRLARLRVVGGDVHRRPP